MNTEEAMIGSTPAGLPVRGVQRSAALLSLTAAWFALALFAALHLLKPELDPSWRLASEYAIGRHRWIMALTFLALAISCASLVVAIHPQVQTVGGRIGLASIAGRCHLDDRCSALSNRSDHGRQGRRHNSRQPSWPRVDDRHPGFPGRGFARQLEPVSEPRVGLLAPLAARQCSLDLGRAGSDARGSGCHPAGEWRLRSKRPGRLAEPPDDPDLLRLARDCLTRRAAHERGRIPRLVR